MRVANTALSFLAASIKNGWQYLIRGKMGGPAKQVWPRPFALTVFALTLLAGLLGPGAPSEAGSVSYTYDAGGRLLAAFDGNGNVANYQYDPLGNLIAIVKSSASSVLVFGYSPDNATNSTVIIYGNNFSAIPSQNTVTICGQNATVTSSTTTQIAVTPPASGVNLPCTITVTSPGGSATGPDWYPHYNNS